MKRFKVTMRRHVPSYTDVMLVAENKEEAGRKALLQWGRLEFKEDREAVVQCDVTDIQQIMTVEEALKSVPGGSVVVMSPSPLSSWEAMNKLVTRLKKLAPKNKSTIIVHTQQNEKNHIAESADAVFRICDDGETVTIVKHRHQ